LIPTRYKSKLGKHLSYPVGAQEISAALAGAPHVDALSLTFFAHPGVLVSPFQRALRERLTYAVLKAEYHSARKPGLSAAAFVIEGGWYDERWELTVYPVLRELRYVANRLLHERGFPALALWLRKAQGQARGMLEERLELVFNPAEQSLEANESSRL
jgi:hypothetical protein